MFKLFRSIFENRRLIFNIAKSDLKNRYLGSFLGSFWSFLIPLLNLVIMWFAFKYGLKAANFDGYPFILWLITGLFPWSFFSESFLNATQSILEKSFLVKKVVFNVDLLPAIKILVSLFLFIFLSAVMIFVFFIFGYYPDIYWLQLPYYFLCLVVLVFSLSWLTSALVVFYRDLNQILVVILQLAFWITPIFWSPNQLPDKLKFISFINPLSYIINGYRSCFFYKTWFWDSPGQTIYFWLFVMISFKVSLLVFNKLKTHFVDML